MTEGGILKARETMLTEEIGSVCGFVMKMGADAYGDQEAVSQAAHGARKVIGC